MKWREPARRRWLHRFSRLVLPLLLLFAVYLLLSAFQALDWGDIRQALARYERTQIALAAATALATYAMASTYEWLARTHERHALPWPSCLGIGWAAYATAANLSALLGNWALRYRLYGQRGFELRQTTRVALFAVGSNWSGFLLLAGSVFALAPPPLPASWPLHALALRAIGVAMLVAVAAYLLLCQRKAGRSTTLRGMRLTVPTLRLAALQLLVSALVWTGLVTTMAQLLPGELPFATVMGVQFLSTIGTLVIRVPAGVGVAEVVFVALLGARLGAPAVIAALLTFRAVFQLLPLVLTAPMYLLLELRGRRLQRTSGAASAPASS